MPVQNRSILPVMTLLLYLLQILIPATIISLVCEKGNLHFSKVLEDGL